MVQNVHVVSGKKSSITAREVHAVVKHVKQQLQFTIDNLDIAFISGEELLKINQEYLQHNYKTDIISFDYTDGNSAVDAELLISVDDAEKNAEKFGVTVKEELIRLVVHGLLHVRGFDDLDKKEKSRMMKEQERLVQEIRAFIK
ncbi:MAG: rRNA maturation RNase YbeY [Ignavibacteria bacterium]|nr:rRNA maturation RNase YbeY [Ignavibacteria bacterium]